jgi:hypothetical protein
MTFATATGRPPGRRPDTRLRNAAFGRRGGFR